MGLIQVSTQSETVHVFTILHNKIDDLLSEVATLASDTGKKFQYAPIILDVATSDFRANDLAVLVEILMQNNMVAVGIRSTKQELVDFAKFSGLAVFPKQANTAMADAKSPKADKKAAYQPPTIVDDRIYAFDQVVAKNSDLVILGEVKSGAEVMASGSILAYQETNGNLFAGIDGDQTAHIFVRNFKAQLISIAGIYKRFGDTSHTLYEKSVNIDLVKGKLRFQSA